MNVGCPQCASIFRVDPAKVPAGGARARCSICGGVVPVPEPTSTDRAEGAAASAQTHFPRPAPAAGTPSYGMPPYASLTAETHTPSGAWPGSETPVGARAATPRPAVAPAVPSPAPAAPAATPVTGSQSVPTATGSHLNPYLARDPHQRARQLARALVSDILTYYPDKHAQALKGGSIREAFSEEVKKSYDDYVAQVGAALAESTTYFQDALNELLAGGAKVF